jgi:hypothetical protein
LSGQISGQRQHPKNGQPSGNNSVCFHNLFPLIWSVQAVKYLRRS